MYEKPYRVNYRYNVSCGSLQLQIYQIYSNGNGEERFRPNRSNGFFE